MVGLTSRMSLRMYLSPRLNATVDPLYTQLRKVAVRKWGILSKLLIAEAGGTQHYGKIFGYSIFKKSIHRGRRLRWESMTPLATPVVPDVKMIAARSVLTT